MRIYRALMRQKLNGFFDDDVDAMESAEFRDVQCVAQ